MAADLEEQYDKIYRYCYYRLSPSVFLRYQLVELSGARFNHQRAD